MLAIGFVLFFGLVTVSLLSSEWTSDRVAPVMVSSRALRYAGDTAATTGVNWLEVNRSLGRDPSLFPADLPCALDVATPSGTVAVTCVGDAGSGQLPTGTWPTETLLQPRSVTILACRRGPGRSGSVSACNAAAGDHLLLRARVRFDVTPDSTGTPATNVPEILAWKHLS